MNNRQEWAELWLSRLRHNLEIRVIRKDGVALSPLFSRDVAAIDSYVARSVQHHVFFGVYGRDGNTGTREAIKEAHCLFTDIDFKSLQEGRLEADGILNTFDLPPTLRILSGNGYHVYWFLAEPTVDLVKVGRLLKGLAARLKGDIQSAEVARILRVPFTRNVKYDPPREVEILSYEPEREYLLTDFAEYEAKEERQQTHKPEDIAWFEEGRRDNDLFHTGLCLLRGGAEASLVKRILTVAVESWGENDARWVDAKVRSALKAVGAKSQAKIDAIMEYVASATGEFTSAQMSSFLDIRTLEERQEIVKVLASMEDDGVIARTGKRNGTYRRVERNLRIMDLDAPTGEPLSIVLPLDLHEIVNLYPKNVCLVSGEKDSGKTAFAMNAAWRNRDIMPVTYFNSEMGQDELRARLLKFPSDYTLTEWKKIRWIEQSSHFEDVINPDGLNIIDFLEVGAEAFTVTEDIRRVFDRLRGGFLLIVMQKRSYREYAVGGEGTLEKARLAVNLEHRTGRNVCKITVAKNWTGALPHPRGYECEYKVANGGDMWKKGDWYDSDKEKEPSKKGFQPSKGEYPGFPHEE